MSGIAITPNLEQLEGQKLPEGKDILQIADSTRPTAIVEVGEKDAKLVAAGMPVKFSPAADMGAYSAKVREVPPTATAASDPSQQNRTLKVRIVFDSPDDRLRMGATGFAHIQVENIPIYNKVWRELRKLVALEKLGLGG